jgi:hypothetical protein
MARKKVRSKPTFKKARDLKENNEMDEAKEFLDI